MPIPQKSEGTVETNLEITCDVGSDFDTVESVETDELGNLEMVD